MQSELQRQGRLPIEECLRLGLSLSAALSHLHKQQLVHRDIKPSNIIFVNGVPKLADIGLVANIKDANSYVGTEGFVPPEGPTSPQADIFGLGKVLYEISTGSDRHSFPRLPAGCEALVSTPQFLELNEVILRACQNDPRQRYQTAEEMHADLTFLLDGKSVKRLRLLERRFARLTKAGIAIAIALVVLGLGYYQVDLANKRRAEIRHRELGSQTAYGIQALEQSHLVEALPYFVEALRLDGPEREATHRARIGLILDQCPKLLQMWSSPYRVNTAQFSHNGRFVVLGSETNGVKVMDVETGEVLCSSFGPDYYLTGACFSRDDLLVLASDQDHSATLWDWKTGRRVLLLPHPGRVCSANFNQAGDRIITGGDDNIARIWDVSTGNEVPFKLALHADQVIYAAFSPDDRTIITTSQDNSALLWDAKSGEFLNRRLVHESWVTHACFSPDGSRVATASLDFTARVWDVATGQAIPPPLRHPDGVTSVEFSPDGRLILTGCRDSTARIWNAVTGEPFLPNPILEHSSPVLHASFHPDGHRIITTCLDGTSRLWDIAATSTTPRRVRAPFSPDGTRFLVESNGLRFAVETRSNRAFPGIKLPASPNDSVFSPNGKFVVTVCPAPDDPGKKSGSELIVWNSESGQRVFSTLTVSCTSTQVAVSDDGHWLAAFWKNAANVYDLRAASKVLPVLPHKNSIQSFSFSPQNRELLVISRSDVYRWELNTGQLCFVLPHSMDVAAARFSADGKLIVTCCLDRKLREGWAQVWDASTGKPLGQPLKHRYGVLGAAFSPNNERVVTASEDFTASIWDRVRGGEPKKLQHQHKVHDACFDPRGVWVLTVSHDQSARLWEAESGEPISPPLPHSSDLLHGIFLDEHKFLTSGENGETWVWEAKPDTHSVEDLTLLAAILNGKRPPPAASPPDQETVYSIWHKMKLKNPEDFETTRAEVFAWHLQQATLAEAEKRWSAAVFHYDHLLAMAPDEHSFQEQREKAIKASNAQDSAPNPH